MSAVPQVLRVPCSFCSRSGHPAEIHIMPGGQRVCTHCREWHEKALHHLAGNLAEGCQECNRPVEVLQEMQIGSDFRMYVVRKDGIYQLLCPTCKEDYVAKQSGYWRGTQFGKEVLKLA